MDLLSLLKAQADDCSRQLNEAIMSMYMMDSIGKNGAVTISDKEWAKTKKRIIDAHGEVCLVTRATKTGRELKWFYGKDCIKVAHEWQNVARKKLSKKA